ncbi:MAG: hypothetical protein KGO02_16190, partial [Alphaproteobacteria bacterium]|nr:hypothetical protein [Alphaproteobacteria bacterium]
KVFEYILPGGWARFVEEGYCTRLDLAVDVEGVRLGEFLVYWPGMRRSRQFFGSGKVLEDTMLRTYEIGKYGGDRYLVVYDKKRQQMKKQGVHVEKEGGENELTRFEVRVRPCTKWSEVTAINNIFSEIKVSSLAAFTSNNDKRFARFLRICQIDGAQNALLMYEDKDRELFRSRLVLAKTPWWSPDSIWKEFKPALFDHLKS